MSRWGYAYRGRDRYELAEKNGIAVDRARKVLTLTADWKGWAPKPPVVEEFPLVLVRACEDCGRVVAVYALGSLNRFHLAAGRSDIFSLPWRWGTWKLIDHGDRFALVRERLKGAASYQDCPQSALTVTYPA